MSDFCIIVPYRDRAEHLRQFSEHMAKHLPGVPIYVIEQADAAPFNRAKLFNVAFNEVGHRFNYMAFHDCDMLPVDADYSSPAEGEAVCLATQCSQFNYQLPYPEYFGGVTLFTKQAFMDAGGFSNHFWGHGGEDDEMYRTCLAEGVTPAWRSGRFHCFEHPRPRNEALYQQNVARLQAGRQTHDGYYWCDSRVVSMETRGHYELIKADLLWKSA